MAQAHRQFKVYCMWEVGEWFFFFFLADLLSLLGQPVCLGYMNQRDGLSWQENFICPGLTDIQFDLITYVYRIHLYSNKLLCIYIYKLQRLGLTLYVLYNNIWTSWIIIYIIHNKLIFLNKNKYINHIKHIYIYNSKIAKLKYNT